jgi:hypothetical protein
LITSVEQLEEIIGLWLIAERESASLAEELIAATCVRQNISPRHGSS